MPHQGYQILAGHTAATEYKAHVFTSSGELDVTTGGEADVIATINKIK